MKVLAIILAIVAISSALPRPYLQRQIHPRIVGGEPATPHEFPYMVSLLYFGSHICAGAIIRGDAVLTVAHCIVGEASSLSIKAGKHNLREQESTEQTRYVTAVHVHPNYQSQTDFSNDIAVLRVQPPFVMTGEVGPIPVAPANHTATGPASIIGWGSLREEGSLPDILYKAEVPIMTDNECRASYGSTNFESHMMCAGFPQGGVDSCTGDSGGPLTANDRSYRYLAGLMSWGYGCARPGYPSVYTEVSNFADFINTAAG